MFDFILNKIFISDPDVNLIDKSSCNTKFKIDFLTFGGGTKSFRDSVQRIKKQVVSTNFFNNIYAYTDFSNDDCIKELFNKHGVFLSSTETKLGNFIWKPFLIDYHLRHMKENDFLLYCDPGCEFSFFGLNIFTKYINTADITGSYFLNVPRCDLKYSNIELFNYLNVDKNQHNTNQVQATWFILKNTSEIRILIKKWLQVACVNDYLYLKKNINNFYRYDQSILSALIKSNNLKSYKSIDHFPPYLYCFNSWIFLYPIHSLRIRSEYSLINPYIKMSNYHNIFIDYASWSFLNKIKKIATFTLKKIYVKIQTKS